VEAGFEPSDLGRRSSQALAQRGGSVVRIG
jgi:hypothetical protein